MSEFLRNLWLSVSEISLDHIFVGIVFLFGIFFGVLFGNIVLTGEIKKKLTSII